jgi:hypothetical protein
MFLPSNKKGNWEGSFWVVNTLRYLSSTEKRPECWDTHSHYPEKIENNHQHLDYDGFCFSI